MDSDKLAIIEKNIIKTELELKSVLHKLDSLHEQLINVINIINNINNKSNCNLFCK